MIELHLTPGEAVKLQNGLKHFATKQLPTKASYAIMRNIEKISMPVGKYIDELKSKYLAEGGELGENFDEKLWLKLDAELFAELNQKEKFEFLSLDILLESEVPVSAVELSLISDLLCQ